MVERMKLVDGDLSTKPARSEVRSMPGTVPIRSLLPDASVIATNG
jgi:hypothetical protein